MHPRSFRIFFSTLLCVGILILPNVLSACGSSSPTTQASTSIPTNNTPTSTSLQTPTLSIPTPTQPPSPTPTPTPTQPPTWNVVHSPNSSSSDNHLNGVVALSASDAWAVGYYLNDNSQTKRTLIEHWNGANWSIVSSPNAGEDFDQLFGVAAASAGDVWAVGYYDIAGAIDQTLIEHWNGSSWGIVSSPNAGSGGNTLSGVAAVSTNDVWAVGAGNGTLTEHWNGSSWSIVSSPNVNSNGTLTGVTAVSSSNAWAVGYYANGFQEPKQTLIEQWNGTSWNVVSSPNTPDGIDLLSGVAALSASNVWAVGSYNYPAQTLIEQWDGTSWSIVQSPSPGSLNAVAIDPSGNVWAVGNYNNSNGPNQTLIEQWNGTNWNVISSPNVGSADNYLNGVTALSASNIWTVGEYYSGNQTYFTLTNHYT